MDPIAPTRRSGRAQSWFTKRTQFDPLFSTKTQIESQIPFGVGGASALRVTEIGRTQSWFTKRTQFDPLFSTKTQIESQIPFGVGGASARRGLVSPCNPMQHDSPNCEDVAPARRAQQPPETGSVRRPTGRKPTPSRVLATIRSALSRRALSICWASFVQSATRPRANI